MIRALLVAGMMLTLAAWSRAESKWTGEVFFGSAHSFSSTLEIRQEGFEEILLDTDYETRAFEDSPYYAWRIGRWSKVRGWEVEFIHHKLYLKNVNREVERFDITHGYNLLLLNYARQVKTVILRVGAGPVISHPETAVRGNFLNAGYGLTGPAAQIAIEKRLRLSDAFFVGLEAKFTIARAVVDIAGGEASAPNAALHGLVGFGFSL